MRPYGLSPTELEKLRPSDLTVAVYGLGKMGLPLAAVFAERGFRVIGVDVNATVVRRVNRGDNPLIGEPGLDELLKRVVRSQTLTATTDPVKAARASAVKIIVLPVALDDDNQADTTLLQRVTETIAKGLHPGDLVIVESTVPPGTTLRVVARTLEVEAGLRLNRDFGVAHCPERASSGTAIADIKGRLNPKIVGGADAHTTEIVRRIYGMINTRGVLAVGDTVRAELVKLWEGVYRDVNIAFANNMYLICRDMGVDARDIIAACNTDHYCHILSPGPGVGGHCIPVYPFFILGHVSAHHELLELARSINDSMATHAATLVAEALGERGVGLAGARVLVLGIAYRGGVKETGKSPGLRIVRELNKVTDDVCVRDPLFTKTETTRAGLRYTSSYEDIDCIVIAADHPTFKDLDWRRIARRVRTRCVVDTVNIVDAEVLQALGFTVRRIGYAL